MRVGRSLCDTRGQHSMPVRLGCFCGAQVLWKDCFSAAGMNSCSTVGVVRDFIQSFWSSLCSWMLLGIPMQQTNLVMVSAQGFVFGQGLVETA